MEMKTLEEVKNILDIIINYHNKNLTNYQLEKLEEALKKLNELEIEINCD